MREVKRAVGLPLRRQELVELCGFYGRASHYELVPYLIKNAITLKKIVVVPHFKSDLSDSDKEDTEEERKSRECAQQQLEGCFLRELSL